MHRSESLSSPGNQPAVVVGRTRTAGAVRSAVPSQDRRRGRALTEFVLIVGVPCFALMCWMLLDSEMRKSLLAASGDPNVAINPVYALVPADRGTIVSLHAQGQVRIWDTAQSALLGEVQCEILELRSGAYNARKRLLAVGSAMGRLEVRDLAHPENSVTSRELDLQHVAACQFTPDGELLITAGEEHAISFWDPRTLRRLHVARFDQSDEVVRCLTMSGDGRYLLAGTHGGLVQVWDVGQRKLIRKISVTEQRFRPAATIASVALLPGDHEFVALSRDGGAAVWNIATGERVRSFDQPLLAARSGTLSTDRNYFAAGNNTGELHVWDVHTGVCVKSTPPRNTVVRAIACDERSELIVTGEWAGEIRWHEL